MTSNGRTKEQQSQMLTGPPPLGTAPDVPSRTPRSPGTEFPDQAAVQDVLGRNPGAFLRPVTLPVHQILQGVLDPSRVQYPADCEGWLAVNDPGGRRGQKEKTEQVLTRTHER